jgi:mRNA-degrading endonuclease RelE of RelBE toxin-antitoxin system
MRLFLTKFFDRDYEKLPGVLQKQCDRQLLTLLKNPHHPSLRVSKIQGFKNIWEGRITKECRFTFQILKDIYLIRRVGKHNQILKKP